MAGFRHIVEEHHIEGSPGMSLTYADTGLLAVTRFGGIVVSYQRPLRVVAAGASIRLRDHLMIARLVVLALLIVANVLSLRRDR